MKRTADPRATPFEFRTGIGMPGFRGMRTVGDPSFIPPTKFRYLQNIRLGSGDVKSRPGLASFDTLAAAAVWLTEINEEVQSATLYLGPASQWNEAIYFVGSPLNPKQMLTNYSRHDFSRIDPGSQESTDEADGNQASSLFGLFPAYDLTVAEAGNTASQAATPTPYIVSDDDQGVPALPDSGWKKISLLAGVGFYQFSSCMDPIVKWQDREQNDRWLCAGTHMGYVWSGVGNYVPPYYSLAGGAGLVAATGDPTVGGQPIFEVNFDTRNPLDRAALLAAPADTDLTPLFAGGLTEVFRMPPPGYLRGAQTFNGPVPTASFDPTMYPNCEWVRSMVSVGRRADDVLTGEEINEETLYLGTVGGGVLAIDGQIGGASDPTTKVGINDPDDGDVWSYDGISLDKVYTGVGHLVCVAATGDGGVLAAGRTAAAYLPEKGASWQVVTYVPGYTAPPGGADYWPQFKYGYAWTSRADFQGKIYLYGFDLGAGFSGNNPAEDIPASLVLAVFDPGALTITVIRTGAAFSQAIAGQTLQNMVYERGITTYVQPVLAASGERLHYMSAWIGGAPIARVNVGVYDGAAFDDDFYEWPTGTSVPWPTDLVMSGNRPWAVLSNPPSFWRLDPTSAISFWRGLGSFSAAVGKQTGVFVGP